MNLLFLVFVSGLVSAAPKGKGEGKPDKGMIQVMVQCLAENWKEEKVEDCISCFKGLENAKTPQEGLDIGKKCVADYLPRAAKNCSSEISALKAGEEPKELMECFEKSLMTMSSESCLEMAGQNDDVTDTFTEGALCMVEGAKNVTQWVKKSLGVKGDGKMKKMMMPLMIKAHCDNANVNEDGKKVCNQCFRDAIKSGKGRGRGRGKGRGKGKSGVVAALKDCSEKNLGDTYKECTDMVGQKGKGQGKLIKKCYSKVLMRSVVESCEKEDSSDDVETFMEVLDCGKDKIKEWVKKNVNAKMAGKLMQFLED